MKACPKIQSMTKEGSLFLHGSRLVSVEDMGVFLVKIGGH